MKNRCYPKYSYWIFVVLAMVEYALSLLPLLFKTDEQFAQIVWSVLMLALGVAFSVAAIRSMQYYYFEDNYLIVRSLFGTIVKLDVKEVWVCIETLPTYSSWVGTIQKEWICIYDNSTTDRFKAGCTNRKKHNRAQIVLTEKNKRIVEQYLKIDTRKIF